ncbi:MAG: pyridoxamine 5'-phosphate oxidase family protein [Dehalococcoidia bacterium]
MATYFDEITSEQRELIGNSPLFFVASVPGDLSAGPYGEGPANLSPKGGNPLHVIVQNRVAYLDFAGSGNETARHAIADGPITIMVCSFSDDAAIVRLYGTAKVVAFENSDLSERLAKSFEYEIALPPRQVIDIKIDRTATTCGYGVPVMNLVSVRSTAYRGRAYK